MKKAPLVVLVLITLSFCTLISCANMNDIRKDLGDGYTYSTDSKYKMIRPNWGYYNTAIYSEITDYKFNNKYIIAKQKPDYEHHKIFISENLGSGYIIYCSYLKDSTSEKNRAIKNVVKSDSILFKILKAKHVTDQNSIQDQQIVETVMDSVFRHDPYYIKLFNANENYWIIDKKNNKRFGPFDKEHFNETCSMLKTGLNFISQPN